MHCLDAGEQPGVQVDGVGVGGQTRRELELHRLQRRVGMGRGQGVEDPAHTRQHLARPLQRHDGVLEAGRRGIGRDGRHLGALPPHALLEGGPEVAVADAIEGRRLVGQWTGGVERTGRGRRSRHWNSYANLTMAPATTPTTSQTAMATAMARIE